MYVYLARADVACPHCGGKVIKLHKIGRSIDPEGRVRNIASQSPSHTAELICIVWTGASKFKQLEDALHMLFAARHHHGEWYDLSVTNVEFIKGLAEDEAMVDKLLVARMKAKRRKRKRSVVKRQPVEMGPTGMVDEGLDWRTWVYGGAKNPIHSI